MRLTPFKDRRSLFLSKLSWNRCVGKLRLSHFRLGDDLVGRHRVGTSLLEVDDL